MAPAANPDTDFRKSRRFMGDAPTPRGNGFGAGIARFVPKLNGTPMSP
jgi:hypothetical protein